MAATRQLTERLAANSLPYELLAVDPESSDPRDQPPSPHAWHVLKAMIDTDPWWLAARGRLSGTLDADRLATHARRDAQGALGSSDHLIVLTNHELAPARDATYQLWSVDREKRHAVISASVIDPYQQSSQTHDRFDVIRRRLRSAICASLGQLVGISRCDNDECYMLDGDISVGDLDHMTGFGAEHPGERLVGFGFDSESRG
jgi:hypothetical protein